jgi:hypothetical protein
MLASTILAQIRRKFFSSELPGNVGCWSPDRPRSIARQKWSRFKPICRFIKTHKSAILAHIQRIFFSSELPGNVGGWSPDRP